MIDKNKIAKAARKCLAAFRKANPDGYSSSIIDIESNCLKNFKDGAKWAINEFQMDLWHPNTEEPDKSKSDIITLCFENDAYLQFKESILWNEESWRHSISRCQINKWAYLSDILPKQKGGEQ